MHRTNRLAISSARGPDSLTTPTAERPGGVDGAMMVSLSLAGRFESIGGTASGSAVASPGVVSDCAATEPLAMPPSHVSFR